MSDPARDLLDPADPPERQVAKLAEICGALMRRAEQLDDGRGAAYAQFERAVLLEEQVRERTRDLERTLDLLNLSNARLADATRAAEAAHAHLAGAIETIQDGFGLFDGEDRMVLCNSRFGMHLPDVRARLRPGMAFSDYVAAISVSPGLDLPAGTGPADWAVERLARHGQEHTLFTVRLRGDRWLQVGEHRMAGGETVVVQTDVSDILRAEREDRDKVLDDQARLVRATLGHLAQGVAVFDARGRLAVFNDRLGEMLSIPRTALRPGLDAAVLVGRLRAQVRMDPPMDADALARWIARPGARGRIEFGFRRGAGQFFDGLGDAMPDGGFVLSITDVSAERAAALALREARDRLEERVAARTLELGDALAAAERANAARSRFVAAASHDLLQPLSAAKLYIGSLIEDSPQDEERSVAAKALGALASVEEIIAALLDISRLESGRASVQVGEIALGPLLARLADEFAPVAAAKGLRLTVRPTAARVRSDPAYLRRILQNLISNAVRYTETGRVLVGLRRAPGGWRVVVADTGPGIPVEEQQNVFREFHRIGPRASASEGLGLGLAIVDRACAMLGHPLDLRSVPGRGTSFCVTLRAAGPARL
ncbi:PAS domain-containing sensor histidine kinase [Wenxinia saemankumensis]|uniref:histidine kinase n=1 Tax=Wenxinia saemankumensis TaxID=1447782 RepID=A0A1M6AAX7_9RHOB|nr:PAS domain-containing sensor histidine kinase [Wenxinia saemankumensis]SHI33625.1 signal transduction histidine kinase [Wenxinia saemankumensis]